MKNLINQVTCGDCLEVMKKLPDNCIDLVVTDPPYGIGEAKGKNKSRGKLARAKDYGCDDWDNKTPSKEYFDEMMRVSKNQIIFGGNYFVEYLTNSPCWIVWDKNNSGDFADCELAWTSFKSAVRKFKFTWNGMLQENMGIHKEIRYHPTQKPVEVMQWIIENYSKDGDIILDPFAGSGTTGRAAKNLGRDFILIEKEQKYVDICNQRLQQQNLF